MNKYMINGDPCSASELIYQAKCLDEQFRDGCILQTSVASDILRSHGYEVTENPEYKVNDEI